MKITVLEHPRIPSEKRFNDIANTPLWSCLMGGYAAAALQAAGFDTTFIDDAQPQVTFDESAQHIFDPRMPRESRKWPDLLCINAVYFWEHTDALFEFLKFLRQKGFSGHINLFGFFPTLMYRRILETCREVDSVAVGEFEHTLVELAQYLESTGQTHRNTQSPNMSTFNGSIFIKGGSESNGKNHVDIDIEGLAVHNGLSAILARPRSPEKNPDIFPFPQRASLEGTVTILGSRGCYNHCSFCPVPSFYNDGPLWRGRSPENIAEEMQMLADQGVREFYFADPNFIGPGKRGKERILALMGLIQPMKIQFGMETRHQDLDDHILEALTASGFNSLLMGIESGSKNVLGTLNKHADTNDGATAIALCRKHGIDPEIGFLMFVPDSTVADLRENMEFLMENRLLDRLERTANLLCHCQIVLAGTSGYTAFEKEGRLIKSGIFGFEAEVTFTDPRVAWMSKLVLTACHTVLRSTGDPASPIYWKLPDRSVEKKLNAYLIEMFYKLLDSEEKIDIAQGKAKSTSKVAAATEEQILSTIQSFLK